ncbi:MAG: signal peptidase II [Candidatus Absconditabacterales bacterium]|nr:signal peptidase II [Candidatus Absconditabacterales bacterium]
MFVSLELIGPTAWIHAHRNPGISFGIPLSPFIVLPLLVGATVLVGWMMRAGECDRWFAILFWSGGWGNGIDRIVFGAVRDFLVFPGWGLIPGFIFNIADVLLSLSLIWLVVCHRYGSRTS